MPDVTIRNLLDLEDLAPRFGLEGVEARFGRGELGLESSGVSYQRLAPRTRLSFGHRHREQEELYVILDGSGRMALEDDVIDVKRWDVIRVAPAVTRCVESGDDGLELLAFGAPRADGDSEMIPGWWASGSE